MLAREQELPLRWRLWRYQAERFSLSRHGVLAVVFGLSAVGLSAALSGRAEVPAPMGAFVAGFVTIVAFLHLRIADEFKDCDSDRRWRPTRPVPRGLVRLRELAGVAVVGALAQLSVTVLLEPRLLALLLLLWGYFALMSVEFFVPAWLRSRPLAYLVSHMPIVPLIGLYAGACDWLVADRGNDPAGLAAFALMCWAGGVVFELGRKIRAPGDEAPGVQTYTALWGRNRTIGAWLAANAVAIAACLWLASRIAFELPALVVTGGLAVVAAGIGIRFLRRPNRSTATAVEGLSGIANLLLLCTVGVLPWLLPS